MFMLDIETTGIDPETEDLLQIALIEMVPTGTGFYHPGKQFNLFQGTKRYPESEFANTHMAGLYATCRETPVKSSAEIRAQILDFYSLCDPETPPEQTRICGWNASSFDLPFLVKKRCLRPPGYEQVDGKDVEVGDYSYRIYEMGGAVAIAVDVLRIPAEDRKAFLDRALQSDPVDISLPPGGEHNAVFDCYRQIKMVNGLIALLR